MLKRSNYYYEATQKQIELERAIRADKREIEALKNLGADYKPASRNLKKHVKEYKNFSYVMDISEKPNRTRVITDEKHYIKAIRHKRHNLVKERFGDKERKDQYNKNEQEFLQKRLDLIDKYTYDVHWYENNKRQYEAKVKNRKEN